MRGTTSKVELRAGSTPIAVPKSDEESSYMLENGAPCRHPQGPPPPWEVDVKLPTARGMGPVHWVQRGVAALLEPAVS